MELILIDDNSVRRMLDEISESIRRDTEQSFRHDRNFALRRLEELGIISAKHFEDFSPEHQRRYRHNVWGSVMLLLMSDSAVRRCCLVNYDKAKAKTDPEDALYTAVMKFLRDEHSKWVKRGRPPKAKGKK
jgi:hypothetical protein